MIPENDADFTTTCEAQQEPLSPENWGDLPGFTQPDPPVSQGFVGAGEPISDASHLGPEHPDTGPEWQGIEAFQVLLGHDYTPSLKGKTDGDMIEERRLRLAYMGLLKLPDEAPYDWVTVPVAAIRARVAVTAVRDAITRRSVLSLLWWGRRLIHAPTLSMARWGSYPSRPSLVPGARRGIRKGHRGRPPLNVPWPTWREAGRDVPG